MQFMLAKVTTTPVFNKNNVCVMHAKYIMSGYNIQLNIMTALFLTKFLLNAACCFKMQSLKVIDSVIVHYQKELCSKLKKVIYSQVYRPAVSLKGVENAKCAFLVRQLFCMNCLKLTLTKDTLIKDKLQIQQTCGMHKSYDDIVMNIYL